MKKLNLSGKIDAQSIAIYGAIDKAAKALEIPYVVVGASARDLVLHFGFNAKLQRATKDIDFGVQIPSWEAFDEFRNYLLNNGFQEAKIQHRLSYEGMLIDLVPCGAIQDDNATIAWPPNGDEVMSVLGFEEAISHAIATTIQDKPKVEIPVVEPAGLSLLKLVSWSDRPINLKNKDAKDFLFLIKTYTEIPEAHNALYEEHSGVMGTFGWDIILGSAYKLGWDAAAIASPATKNHLANIENNQIDKRPRDMLVENMCDNIEDEFEINEKLLDCYFQGFHNSAR